MATGFHHAKDSSNEHQYLSLFSIFYRTASNEAANEFGKIGDIERLDVYGWILALYFGFFGMDCYRFMHIIFLTYAVQVANPPHLPTPPNQKGGKKNCVDFLVSMEQ